MDRIDDQAGLEIHLQGSEPAFLFPFRPGRVRLGVAEPHAQIGAHDLQMIAGEDFALDGTTTAGGDTNLGGGFGDGTVFQITRSLVMYGLTSLYSFTGANDGANPQATLVQGSDGCFYGTTTFGGTNGYGTVFQITAKGAMTVLYSFQAPNDDTASLAALVQGNNGTSYGTTLGDGNAGNGTVFAINPNGTGFTTLYSFSAGGTNTSGAYTNSDGAMPDRGLILAGDTLYGTTGAGGSSGNGTVFSLTLPGPQLSITLFRNKCHIDVADQCHGFALGSSLSLGAAAVWNNNSTAPIVISGQNVVTNPITGTQMFFRLMQCK
jgi:uncharacterized repeat protein (TIGR03803 family)